MDITGPVMNIENLFCLGNCTKQWVVATLPHFFFLLKPTAMPSAWRPALNTEPSKSRVTRESLSFTKTLKNLIFQFVTHLLDTDLIGIAQRALDDRRIRQSPQTELSLDPLIIAAIVYIPQFPAANDQMYNKQHQNDVMTINLADLQVTETSLQPFLESYTWKEALKEKETGIRNQILRFEYDFNGCSGFTLNIGFALFHISGFRFGWYVVFVSVYCTNSETSFFIYSRM
jgi:hypothetical protein